MTPTFSRNFSERAVDRASGNRGGWKGVPGSSGLYGKTTKLGDYLRASVDYESWKTKLDPNLQDLVMSSRWPIFLSLLISSLLLVFVPLLFGLSPLGIGAMATGGLGVEAQIPTLLLLMFFAANAIAAVGLLFLFWVSDGLDAPVVRRWHWVAFSASTVADADMFVAGSSLIIGEISFWIGLALLVVGLFMAGMVLSALAGASR